MTTAAVTANRVEPRAQGAYDRVFYGGMAVAMALTVFAGFARTYYLRSYFGVPTISGVTVLSPLVHVHGLLFSSWVLLFIVQTALVARRQVAVHRRLGIAGVVLASAMIVVGSATAIANAARGSGPPGVDPLAFLAIPLFDMVLFAGFIVAAVRMRRQKEAHKRLMLLAYVSIIAAAVARLPGMFPLGPLAFFGVSFLFVLAGVFYDRWSRGRIHPAYVWGGAMILVSVPLRLAISGTAAWRGFAEFLTAMM